MSTIKEMRKDNPLTIAVDGVSIITGAADRRLALNSKWFNNRPLFQDSGRLFLCLGSMLSMHVPKTIKCRTQ